MKRFSYFILVIFILFNGEAFAEQGTKAADTRMDTLVVTAGRVVEKQRDVTVNMMVIDSKEISLSAATDLGGLLAEKGFGAIKRYPGSLTSFGLRGFRTETHGNDLRGHVLILIDGRRAGSGNAAKFLTKNIERVEIIKGPGSVIYGSAGMGGVVNIITKRGRGKPSLFVETTAGSYDYREVGTGLSGSGKGFDFSGALSYETTGDYETATGEKYLNTGCDRLVGGSFNLGYEIYPGHRIGVIYTHTDINEAGSPGYLSQVDEDDYTDKSNYSVDFSYDGRTSTGRFFWKIRYFTGQDKDSWYDPVASNPDGWDDGDPSKRKTQSAGMQAQVSMETDLLRLTAGFDWVDYEVTATWNPYRTTYDNPAGFLLAKTSLYNDRLILSAGLRYDGYRVSVKEPEGNTADDNHLGLRFGAAFLPLDWLKLRAGYSGGFVMPGADQMAADYTVWGTHYVGNPDLKPEISTTTEGGADIFYGPLNISLTYFHTAFEDKIVSTTLSGGSRSWENLGRATIAGFEGDFSCDMAGFFNWDFQLEPYFRWVRLVEFKDNETGQDLLETSDLNASGGIRFSGFNGFDADLQLTFYGSRTVTDYEGGWPYQDIKLDAFTLARLTLVKKFWSSDRFGGLAVKFTVQNLFDNNYSHVKGYPMPGRSFYLGLRYDL